MLLVFANRHQLVELAGGSAVNQMVELGVFEGEFSEHCNKRLNPKRYTLIDLWDYDEYTFVLEDAPQMRGLRAVYSEYFRNDPKETLAAAYEKTRSRFAGMQNIEILRMDMSQAVDRFPDASLDFIYLDGNHTYEYVLRDLYEWFPKLSKGGLFVCNDFYESSTAAKQNLGVIPAFITFAKRHSAYPIAVTSSDWSDLYFSNAPTSPMIEHLRARIFRSPFPVVELPDGLLGSYRHELLEPADHPPRLIPSFDLRGAP